MTTDWSLQVLYRCFTLGRKLLSRMATTARITISPALLGEVKLEFQCKMRKLLPRHGIPEDLIINFDQTPSPYIGTASRTYHEKGTSYVPLIGKAKKKQINGTLTVTISDFFLSVQLIYQETNDRCLPKGVHFSDDSDVICTENHRSNESKAIQYF